MKSERGKAISHFFDRRTQAARRQLVETMASHEQSIRDIEEQRARRQMLEAALADLQSAQCGLTRVALYDRSRKVGIVLAQMIDTDVSSYELQKRSDELLHAALEHKADAAIHHKKFLKVGRWILSRSHERDQLAQRSTEREIQETGACRK